MVGAVDDPAELEADRVADVISRAVASAGPTSVELTPEGRVQRSAASPNRETLQRQSVPVRVNRSAGRPPGAASDATPSIGADGGQVDDATSRRIQRSTGNPIEPGVRRKMEHTFGTDLGHVSVHTGSEAKDLSNRIQAKAFTTGSNVFFRDGVPDTNTQSGAHLFAHELTHVVQQTGGGDVQRAISDDTGVIRRRNLDEVSGEHDAASRQLNALELELDALKLELASASFFSKPMLKHKISKKKKAIAKLRTSHDLLADELAPLRAADQERRRQEQAEQQRLAAEAQQRKDASLQTYGQIAAKNLAALVEYVTQKSDWHEHSALTDEQRDLIRAVHSFAIVPGNIAPCSTFTVADFASATSSTPFATLTGQLDAYVAAAGSRAYPFEIGLRSTIAAAAATGAAIGQLQTAFPDWVLKTAMTDRALGFLMSRNLIADLITYYTFARTHRSSRRTAAPTSLRTSTSAASTASTRHRSRVAH